MTHVREDLTALLDGGLDPERQAEAEAHLAGCAECRAEQRRLATVLSAVAALAPLPGPAAGFEQRFYARLAREKAQRPPVLRWLRRSPWRFAVPAVGLGAAAVAVALSVLQARSDRLEMARHLDLLENYVVVASLGSVETAEDVEVVAHLDELREGRP